MLNDESMGLEVRLGVLAQLVEQRTCYTAARMRMGPIVCGCLVLVCELVFARLGALD